MVCNSDSADLLHIQVVFLYGLEAVKSQIVVRLTEDTNLSGLRFFTLDKQETEHQCVFMSSHLIGQIRRHLDSKTDSFY